MYKRSTIKPRLVIFVMSALLFGCTQTKTTPFNVNTMNSAVDSIVNGLSEPVIPELEIDLIDYSGHKPDSKGSFDFREAIQSAINELSAKGGGRLIFSHTEEPKAWDKNILTYRVSGPIELQSNIALCFEPSVRLFFEFNPENYTNQNQGVITRYEGTTCYGYSPCIRAFNVSNVSLVALFGYGAMPIIDGDGEKWRQWEIDESRRLEKEGKDLAFIYIRTLNNTDVPIAKRKPGQFKDWLLRPDLIQFFLSKNIKVDGLKISNSPFWCIHPVFSSNITIRNLFYDASVVNNDGIDPESSKNILIENIIFNNHDDNVAIKAGRDKEGREGALVAGTPLEAITSEFIVNGRIMGSTENVVIRNCVFKGHHAVAIGSEMSGGVKNVYILNSHAVQDVFNGIYIKSSRIRGGSVSNIYANNVHFANVLESVICLIPNYDNDTISAFPPTFSNIHLNNISAASSEYGIRIHGWGDAPIKNISISNSTIEKVFSEKIHYNQVQNLQLINVRIDKTDYHQTINDTITVVKPPQSI